MFAGHPIQDSKPQFKEVGRKPEIRREEPLRPLYVIKAPHLMVRRQNVNY